MAHNVVAFVGQNENRILEVVARQFLDLLKPFGLPGHVINLHDPDWKQQLEPLIQEGILFAFGSAGIGAALTLHDKNLWDAIQVPFISSLADNPAQMPANHRINARFVVNGYHYREHFDVQREIVRSAQISTMLPHGVTPNPDCGKIPWSKRSHRIVFLKSGGDPEAKRAQWAPWPGKLREILEESSKQALLMPTGDVTPIVMGCVKSYGIEFSEKRDMLLAMLNEVDWYVRLVRLTMMARALCRVDADIFGARWEHIDQAGARARFHPAVDAALMHGLFADTKYIVNVTPNFASGTHERVPNGFAAKACVVSDDNTYTLTKFHNLPSYFGFSWADPDWEAKLIDHLESHRTYDDELEPAFQIAHRDFNGLNFMQSMIQIAEVVRFGERLSGSH
ncbi:MAG TPA: hypothetical protein VHX20_09000 [Terracidiphilus sp.]|jgi:hypothetical protein|nr:hypothetical protein [Terracidiphilus sp.]